MDDHGTFKLQAQRMQGPILVLGASGFVGANLFRALLRQRSDVYGTTSPPSAWRLSGLAEASVVTTDLLVDQNLINLFDRIKPKTVFDCVAYGAYSFEQDIHLIYRTNFTFAVRLIEHLIQRGVSSYIHAGSSSEYGDRAGGPDEAFSLNPNSHYSVSKAAASNLLFYSGKKLGLPCANLRLYSVYGPYEDASRLIPTLVIRGLKGEYPNFVNPDISRDFVYVDDVTRAFVAAADQLRPENYGESFNIGTGKKTTMRDVSNIAKEMFNITAEPVFNSMPDREGDVSDWYAKPVKAHDLLGWAADTTLHDGLRETTRWLASLPDVHAYERSSKKYGLDRVYSVSVVVACYWDAQIIPEVYARLKTVLEKLRIEHEIIFCVLLRGDLRDPPELIEAFVTKWKEGIEVVYGTKTKSAAPFLMRLASSLFYKMFDRFSYLKIPHNAGDFSLIDKLVVDSLLQFPERDLFIMGVRAFAGFKQTGVDYLQDVSPKTEGKGSFLEKISRAKKGILSFSNTPLNMLSLVGVLLFGISSTLILGQVVIRILRPDVTPSGITTTLIAIIFFGSINFLAVGILGEYIAKVIEEVKRRPHSILRHVIKDGEIRAATIEQSEENRRGAV